MAFSPVAFIAPNYRDFKNYWLKAYIPGTTTPKVMALESDGGTQVAKLEINKDGFLESAGGALVIPYLEGAYDLWVFPTEAEADANNTVNAERVADNILGIPADEAIEIFLIGDLSQAYEPWKTVAEMQADQTVLPVGKKVSWHGYHAESDGGSNWGIVKSGAHTDDGGSIFTLNDGKYVAANITGKINVKKFGSDFNSALAYIMAQPNEKVSYSLMQRKDYILKLPTDVYEFDTGLTPLVGDPLATPISITIEGNGSMILASNTYDGSKFLDFKHLVFINIKNVKFQDFNTNYVITVNGGEYLNIEWSRAYFTELEFINCEFGIDFGLESCGLFFEKVYFLGPDTQKAIIVQRTDQVSFSNCRFDFWQTTMVDWDTFIDLTPDIYETGIPDNPGLGRYNVPRINVENCFFIPIGSDVGSPHTGWFGHYGGLLVITGCHFGPEASNRPSIVINYAEGAVFDSGGVSIVENGVIIRDSSCASSFDLIYCRTRYPNVIEIDNVRLDVLDYSVPGLPKTHLVGGDAAVLNPYYNNYSPSARNFNWNFKGASKIFNAISPVDRQLTFPKMISNYVNTNIARFAISNNGRASEHFMHDTQLIGGFQDLELPICPDYGLYKLQFRGTLVISGVDHYIAMEHKVQFILSGDVMSLIILETISEDPASVTVFSMQFYIDDVLHGATVDVSTYPIDTTRITVKLIYESSRTLDLWVDGTTSVKLTRIF